MVAASERMRIAMFKMKLETDNAAFDDGERMHEVARILRQIAERIESGTVEAGIFDSNGSRAGRWRLELDEEEEDDDQ